MLARQGFDSAALDAKLLAQHALGLDALQLAMRENEPVAEPDAGALAELVRRRMTGESVARIIGVPVDLRIVSPYWLTSVGRFGCACATRFWTLTWSMFGSVPMSNVTVSDMVPSLPFVDCM